MADLACARDQQRREVVDLDRAQRVLVFLDVDPDEPHRTSELECQPGEGLVVVLADVAPVGTQAGHQPTV